MLPVRLAFQALVTLAPDGRAMETVQPLTGAEPAVICTAATKPPAHWLIDTEAEQPVPAGGVVGVVGGVVVGGVVGLSERVGVCQSLQSDRLPAFRLEILNVPGALPVFS